jgi:PadR family transcriptional regulator AphA
MGPQCAAGELPELSLSQWAVLGLLVVGPRHGFALAGDIAPTSSLGRVWKVPRPLVYRAIATLEQRGLVERAGVEQAPAGPQRTPLHTTQAGEQAFRRWVELPVEHLRDLRSELLVKLWFHDRLGTDPGHLTLVQLGRVEAMIVAFESEPIRPAGFDATLLEWRLHTARAAAQFLRALSGATA